jgi:hypothetical protein
MPEMIVSLHRAAAVVALSLLALLPAASAATGATHPQRRQIAVTTLTSFKVVLTVTRSPIHRQVNSTARRGEDRDSR